MKMRWLLVVSCILIFQACGDPNAWKADLPAGVLWDLVQAENRYRDAQDYLQEYQANKNYQNLYELGLSTKKLILQFERKNLTDTQLNKLLDFQHQVDSLKNSIEKLLRREIVSYKDIYCNSKDLLLTSKIEYPFYAYKGDSLFCQLNTEAAVTVSLYNADTKQLLKRIPATKHLDLRTTAPNAAVYLITIDGANNAYGDIFVATSTRDISHLINRKQVKTETIEASKNDFRVETVKDVKMKSIFDEPRKFTLRGQFKAVFSGSARALVPIQVPAGATDILYSLRISTNEGTRSSDGEFEANMNISHKKIRFLGLPIYESQKGSGLLATLLGENQPPREEDAYINMYVFYDASQARKFQDGGDVTTLKYNLDYSTIGTQSCNGRIPSRGYKTIYLAFENERMRYNNYVWLEALTSTPTTTYFTKRYTLE